MRFAVVVLAVVLAVANAQNSGKYVASDGRYRPSNRYNNPFSNQYNSYKPYGGFNQYKPYENQYNYNRKPYQPYVISTTTAFPRPSVTVTPAPFVPPKVTPAPFVPPKVTPAPVVSPVVPVVAPVVPVVTAARVAADARSAETIKYGNEISPNGEYSYFFETNNGIAAQAQGVPRNFGGNPPVVPDVAQGSFSWYSPEGQLVAINWVADENGYQPTGDAIPQPPPLPAQIARALAYVARSAPVSAVAAASKQN